MTHNKYPIPMVVLHYIVAVLMIATYFLAENNLMLHKSFGAMVLLFGLLRLVTRLGSRGKTPVSINPPNSKSYYLEKSVHGFLYLVMLLTPLMGWLLSNVSGYPVSVFGLFDLPTLIAESYSSKEILKEIHELMGNAFMLLLVAHVAGAVYHLVKEKVNVFKRMWF